MLQKFRAIKNKHSSAGYDDVSVIIPSTLFDEKKAFLLIEVPCCEINEPASKHFIKKFHQFTNEKNDVQ